MRLTIGSWILDSTPASSTVTTASLRLDMDLPLVPRLVGNEFRIPSLRIYVEAANEAGLKTAIDAIELAFRQADGKTVTFFNTTGTAIMAMDTADWPSIAIEHTVNYGDNNARIDFDVVGTRPGGPVSAGAADEAGQRGEIEWDFEIGPNGLQGATATAEFGPVGGTSARANAATWVAKFYTNPPTGIPAFFSSRLRPVHALPVASQKPNQSSLTNASYDPFAVSVLFREVYSGVTAIPSLVTDLVANVSMVNSEAMDVRSGETNGPAILALSGYFTIITEAPTNFLTAAAKVDRAAIFSKALEVYETIEADFKSVHARFGLSPLGDPIIETGLDSGRVTFSRAFSTTRVLKWQENTWIQNTDRKVFTYDYKGRLIKHQSEGKPVIQLTHDFMCETLDSPRPYIPPVLSSDWERMDKGQNVTVEAMLRGGTLVFVTRGTSNWRFIDPNGGGGGDTTQASGGGRIVTHGTIGQGVL